MITSKEAWAYFRTKDWVFSRDEVGDSMHKKTLSDRIVSVSFDFRKTLTHRLLRSSFSVSTRKYLEISAYVGGDRTGSHILSAGKTLEQVDFTFADLDDFSNFLINWAKDVDIEHELAQLCALPTSAPGNRPIRHLAALAVTKDTETLKRYQRAFESGDRLGFVPYIKKDFIDRAVEAANG